MKTKQVRKNRNAATPAPQAKTPDDLKLPKGDVHPSCLCIYDRLSGGPVEKIPLTESDFFEVLKMNALHERGAVHFVAEAIREKQARSKTEDTRVEKLVDGTDTLYRAAMAVEEVFFLIQDMVSFEGKSEAQKNQINGTINLGESAVKYLLAHVKKMLDDAYPETTKL
jgi:hypothetical protein